MVIRCHVTAACCHTLPRLFDVIAYDADMPLLPMLGDAAFR